METPGGFENVVPYSAKSQIIGIMVNANPHRVTTLAAILLGRHDTNQSARGLQNFKNNHESQPPWNLYANTFWTSMSSRYGVI